MARFVGFLVLMVVFHSMNWMTEAKKKKSVLDYDEKDLHNVYKEWLENDQELERDDLDEMDIDPSKQRRPPPSSGPLPSFKDGKVDPSQILRMANSGKPVMMFVAMEPGADQSYTEAISLRWAQSLLNAHLQVERYVVAPDRVLLMVRDGAQAWDIKEYLVKQTECVEVVLNSQQFPCAGRKGQKARSEL